VANRPGIEGPEFRRLVRGDERADLTRIALELAQDAYPDLEMDHYLSRIDALADRVRDRCRDGARLSQILGQINWVLYTEEGFRGNVAEYDDPRNSYLNEVLDRRLGIPISLSVLYLAIAGRLGLAMAGVNLPGHFVIRTVAVGEPIFVDPFHEGQRLDRAGCARRVAEIFGQAVTVQEDQLAPCQTSTIVVRMLRNLKALYLREADYLSSLPVQRRIVAVTQGDPQERRDLGLACLHADQPGEAISHLEAYLDAQPQAKDAAAVAALLRVAWSRVAHSN
jgi:regulator of sirC expression with transglutaminase-like and TPR domain